MKRLSLLAAAAAVLLASPALAESPFWPVQPKNAPVAAELRGAWKSRGYGWIVLFGPDGAQLFHTAGGACYPDPRREPDPDGVLSLWRAEGPGVISLTGDPSGTRYQFDRLPNLPTDCISAAGWTPDRVVAFAADTFAEVYPRSAERKLDWAARKAKALARVGPSATDDQLWLALTDLLSGLDDPHVELHGTVQGARRDLEPGEAPTLLRVRAADPAGEEKAWLQAYREGILTGVLKGQGRQAANNRVFWGRVDDVGYLNIVTMGAFARNAAPDDPRPLDAVLDEALAAFVGAKAVVVDVSNNRGGYDTISRRIAARFTDQPRIAYAKVPVGGKGSPQVIRVEPSGAVAFTGPVYVVTSDITGQRRRDLHLDDEGLAERHTGGRNHARRVFGPTAQAAAERLDAGSTCGALSIREGAGARRSRVDARRPDDGLPGGGTFGRARQGHRGPHREDPRGRRRSPSALGAAVRQASREACATRPTTHARHDCGLCFHHRLAGLVGSVSVGVRSEGGCDCFLIETSCRVAHLIPPNMSIFQSLDRNWRGRGHTSVWFMLQ